MSLQAQFQTGVDNYRKHFGRNPKGFWLPECAYRPSKDERAGIEKFLHEAGIEYFFTESFVIKGGETAEVRRVVGPYGSVQYLSSATTTNTGLDTYEAFWLKEYQVAVMGRHEEAGYKVWSADHGYPATVITGSFTRKTTSQACTTGASHPSLLIWERRKSTIRKRRKVA
ncbi:MAG: hypothetical protein HC888_13955 [Candidatus Competibacteraceae bacterium]|nr:hypothetical protein [Candidatus Competibacteraceae bacterium]